jgi:Domain of unknown function (DUF4143)
MTAQSGYAFKEAKADREYWGRLVESAVGACLVNAAAAGDCEVFYWRERGVEVDFIVRSGRMLTALEVKTGRASAARSGFGGPMVGIVPTPSEHTQHAIEVREADQHAAAGTQAAYLRAARPALVAASDALRSAAFATFQPPDLGC